MSKQFIIEFSGRAVLNEEEIWPDGDAPEEPNSEDVQEIVESEGLCARSILDEWNLGDVLRMRVYETGLRDKLSS